MRGASPEPTLIEQIVLLLASVTLAAFPALRPDMKTKEKSDWHRFNARANGLFSNGGHFGAKHFWEVGADLTDVSQSTGLNALSFLSLFLIQSERQCCDAQLVELLQLTVNGDGNLGQDGGNSTEFCSYYGINTLKEYFLFWG